MGASNSICEVRKILLEVLEAHPPYKTVPSRILLSDGRALSVRYENGHVIRYENGEQFLLINEHKGDIVLVATSGWDTIEAVSRSDGHLQGIDRLPDSVKGILEEITTIRSQLN